MLAKAPHINANLQPVIHNSPYWGLDIVFHSSVKSSSVKKTEVCEQCILTFTKAINNPAEYFVTASCKLHIRPPYGTVVY